jgi:hypothetical protein
MKRKCLFSALVLISCILLLLAGCQQQAKSGLAAEPGKPSPRITFDKTLCDLGQVGPNKKNTGQIKFTNTGEALLKITKVDKCCGIVTKLDKTEYEPGESGTLQIEWNSGPLPSTMRRTLTIHSNDPRNPATALSIAAKVVLQIDWEPKTLKLFLDKENAGCPNITVTSLDGQPFSILQFKSTADCVTADYDPAVEATKFVLEPRVNIEAMPKNLKGRININLTHPEGKEAVILFSVLPEYTIRPSMIIALDTQPGKPIEQRIDVINNYQKDFEIESLTSKGDIVGVKVREQRHITDGYRLQAELTVQPSEDKTNFTGELYVNIKGGKKLPISCKGYYPNKKTGTSIR